MEKCPTLKISSLMGRRWTISILEEIGDGKGIGFNDLSRSLKKITPKILSQRLHQLEGEGMIYKQMKNGPLRTQYNLTLRGMRLLDLVSAMKAWAEEEDGDMDGCSQRKCSECGRFS